MAEGSNSNSVGGRKDLLDLPVNVLGNIAKFLRTPDLFSFRTTSRLCRQVANTEVAQRKSMFINTKESFLVYLELCQNLRKIEISDIDNKITDEHLSALLMKNPLLEIFIIDASFGISSKGVMPLLKCEKLVSLKISMTTIDDGFLELLTLHNNQLLEVEFDSNSFSANGVATFLANQPKLQYLHIPAVDFIQFDDEYDESGMTMELMGNRVLSAIIGKCNELRCICVSMDEEDSCEADLDSLIIDLVKKCPKLQIVAVSEEGKLRTKTVRFLRSRNVVYLRDDPSYPSSDYEHYDIDDIDTIRVRELK